MAALASLPALAQAQADTYPPTAPTVENDRARLLARNGAELALDPIPTDPAQLQFEMSLLEEQIDSIDVAGINAVQWIGAILLAGGGAITVIGALMGLLVAAGGNRDEAGEVIGFWAAIGLPIAAVGGLMVGLAELDPGLQRRRELGGRYQQLRRAQRYGWVQPSMFATPTGGGVMLSGGF